MRDSQPNANVAVVYRVSVLRKYLLKSDFRLLRVRIPITGRPSSYAQRVLGWSLIECNKISGRTERYEQRNSVRRARER